MSCQAGLGIEPGQSALKASALPNELTWQTIFIINTYNSVFYLNLAIFNRKIQPNFMFLRFLDTALKIIIYIYINTCTNMFIPLHYVLYIVAKYWAVVFFISYFIGDFI